MPTYSEPTLIRGDLAIDDRGSVGFVNDFSFDGVKRFYTVRNHRRGFVRAWHGHRHEAKFVTVTSGSALIGAVPVVEWQSPDPQAPVKKFVLSSLKPGVLYIPAGYANGFMSLTEDARLMFFSTATLQESLNDDIRFPSRFWDIWTPEER